MKQLSFGITYKFIVGLALSASTFFVVFYQMPTFADTMAYPFIFFLGGAILGGAKARTKFYMPFQESGKLFNIKRWPEYLLGALLIVLIALTPFDPKILLFAFYQSAYVLFDAIVTYFLERKTA